MNNQMSMFDIDLDAKDQGAYRNPMVRTAGMGPTGKSCGDCAYFVRRRYNNKTYFKCGLRKITYGAGTDIRKGWQACARFADKHEGGDK